MDGKLWKEVYRIVMSVDHPSLDAMAIHDDRTIVLVYLRAVADDQTVFWACDPANWAGLEPPPSWPSQPTMSRRLRKPSVQALLLAVSQWLQKHEPDRPRTLAIDGRPLMVNAYSKDRDAVTGYAIRGFARGYKLHAIWGTGPMPLAWEITPLNRGESVVARQLVESLSSVQHRCYLIGDSAYDSNPLHAVTAAAGYQLLAPQKRPGRALGKRTHHPSRVRALSILARPYGQHLYKKRTRIEREFGHLAIRPEGLDQLPAHVRRLRRVKQFVHGKLILNGFRKLNNENHFLNLAT